VIRSRFRVRTLMIAVVLAAILLAVVVLCGRLFRDLHVHDFYFRFG
jgi:hypothetical protein